MSSANNGAAAIAPLPEAPAPAAAAAPAPAVPTYSHNKSNFPNDASVERLNEWGETINKLQSYEQYQELFKRYRNAMKKVANMFLFGEPKDDLLMFCLKMYHENMLKNVILSYGEESIKTTLNDFFSLNCMVGVMRTSDNKLYVTISEDMIDDRNYKKKREMILALMMQANIRVLFDEEEINENNPVYYPGSPRPVNKYYRGSNIIGAKPYGVYYTQHGKIPKENLKKVPNLNRIMFLNPGDGPFDYNEEIWNYNLTVTWIDSIRYIKARRQFGANKIAFKPFKRYSDVIEEKNAPFIASQGTKAAVYEVACNNGSLCTEAKLFGYYHKVLNPAKRDDLPQIDGFVAYWIKSSDKPFTTEKGEYIIGFPMPPDNHIIESYCFKTTNTKEKAELDKLTNDILKVLEAGSIINNVRRTIIPGKQYPHAQPHQTAATLIASLKPDPNFNNIIMYMVQPMSLACPGCLSNVDSYLEGKMTEVNLSNCYVPKRRKVLVKAGGGRQTKRHRSTKRRTRRYIRTRL